MLHLLWPLIIIVADGGFDVVRRRHLLGAVSRSYHGWGPPMRPNPLPKALLRPLFLALIALPPRRHHAGLTMRRRRLWLLMFPRGLPRWRHSCPPSLPRLPRLPGLTGRWTLVHPVTLGPQLAGPSPKIAMRP